MSEEKDLKEKGEELAKRSVQDGLASKQLKILYKIAKTRPMSFLEVYTKRQIGRQVDGFESCGTTILELLNNYAENKAALQKILMYANMLYPYFERQTIMGMKEEVEPVVKQTVQKFGYRGLEISEKRGQTEFRVKLANFRGNPAILSSEIARKLKEKVPRVSKFRFRVWIEKT